MADEKISLELFIEADKANLSLGELEQGFDAMKEKLKTVGRGSEEFKQLSTSMAQTTKEIKNIELGFEGLDKEQVASELGSVAGAVGDVTASLILMGGESETLEQIGASIEKAMAISMGMKGAIEGLSSANKLYNNLLKQGKVAVIAKSIAEKAAAAGTWLLNAANKALNTTLKMNPIGLILIAITAVVGAIVYFKDSIMGLIDTALKPFQFAIDMVVDALQWLGIMESDSEIAVREAEEAKSKATTKAANERIAEFKRLEKANKELTDKLVADKDWEIEKLKAAGKDTTKLEREKLVMLQKSYAEQKRLQLLRLADIDAEVERNGLLSSMLSGKVVEQFAANKQLERSNKDLLESSKALEIFDIEVKTAGSLKRKKIRDDEAKDKVTTDASDKAVVENAKKLAAELIKTLDDLEAKAIKDKNIRALAEQELAHTRAKEALRLKHGENKELEFALDAAQLVERNALDDSIEKEAIDKEAERVAAAKAIKDKAKKEEEDEDADALARKFALATAAVGALSALNSAALATDLLNAAGDEVKKEKIRKASFEREKKLNIAMALINGAQAVIAGFAQGGLPMAILAGVTAAAQLAAIVATTYQGGGAGAGVETPTQEPRPDGAGAGGNGANINPVSNTSTILGGQQVTVTETDITSTQNNVSVIEESATF